MVLSKGEIVESGTHNELLRLDKVYARLVQSQLTQGDDDGMKKSQEIGRTSLTLSQSRKGSGFERQSLVVKKDKVKEVEEFFIPKKTEKDIEDAKKEEERIKNLKKEEDANFFKQSQEKLVGLFSDIKWIVASAVFASGLNGGIWPVFGWFMANGIEALGNKDTDIIKSKSTTIVFEFLGLAFFAGFALFLQM